MFLFFGKGGSAQHCERSTDMNTKFKEKIQENEGSTAYRDPVSGASAENSGLREIYPLAQNQKGILAECLANPDTTIYNLPVLYRLSDRLDLMRLKKAESILPFIFVAMITTPS